MCKLGDNSPSAPQRQCFVFGSWSGWAVINRKWLYTKETTMNNNHLSGIHFDEF